MADLITRCPKCTTAFRISEDLIKSAKGVVRCGSCLNVFNAKEYLVKQNPSAKKIPVVPAPRRSMSKVISDLEQLAKSSKALHQTKTNESTNNTSDDKLIKPQVLKQPQKLKKPNSDNSMLFERALENETATEEDNSVVDEAWALELLKEDDSNPKTEEVQIRKVIEESPPLDKKEIEAKHEPITGMEKNPTQSKQESIDSTSDNTNTETTPKAPSIPTQTALTSEETSTPERTEPSEAQTKAEAGSEEMDDEPATLINTIAAIELEPLESILSDRKSTFLQKAAWLGACTFALLILVGQIGWLQFHKLNQKEPYRTAYSIACVIFACDLPVLSNRSKINTSNLLIRSHPEKEGALLVDVILINNAHFEQTFPNLRLTFTDLKNAPIATRQLEPSAYLGGEMTGQKMMPIKQAIHIAIEIVDPGSKAVSYSIAIEN